MRLDTDVGHEFLARNMCSTSFESWLVGLRLRLCAGQSFPSLEDLALCIGAKLY